MISSLILAAAIVSNFPFASEHRYVGPLNMASTNFYGSVTGIVNDAYISAHGGGGEGGGGLTTNDVKNIMGWNATTGKYGITVTEADEAGYSDEADAASVNGSIDTRIKSLDAEKQSVTNLITFWEQDEDDEYGVGSTNKYPSTRMLYAELREKRGYTDLSCFTNGQMLTKTWESVSDVRESFFGIQWSTSATLSGRGFALANELIDAEDTPIQALWENAIAYIAIPNGGDFLYMAFGMEDEKCAIKFVYTVNGGSVNDVLSVDAGTEVSSFRYPKRGISITTYYFMGEDSLAKVSQIPQVEVKRDLTNNVCAKTSATFGSWAKDNLPSGVTWNDQPTYDASIDLWEWGYNGGSAQSEEGGADATTLTFGYGEGFTSTRTATAIALSNDVFTTHAFVTNIVSGKRDLTNRVWQAGTDWSGATMAEFISSGGIITLQRISDNRYSYFCSGLVGSGTIYKSGSLEYWGSLEEANSATVGYLVASFGIGPVTRTPPVYLALTSEITNGLTQAQADARYAPTNVAATVAGWETYWTGDKVRLSVTNYYGNTSGELPRLRIEEFDHSVTTTVAGVDYVTNVFKTVWDEESRHTNYQASVDARVASLSNDVVVAAWQQTANQLAGKAPKAWGTVTSAGGAAPANTVWHTEPNTVFAGGTEYAHVAVGEGSICVLTAKGASVYTEGEEGQFRFKDDSGENYFGFDVRQSYTLGCRTDGIAVNQAQHLVTLTYDLTASDNPTVMCCTNLLTGTWSEVEVTWEENPPANTKVCYIDVGTSPQGFYKAQMTYAGGSKFVTNMQADLAGGIASSNEVLHVVQSVVPYITSSGVVWRVKQ